MRRRSARGRVERLLHQELAGILMDGHEYDACTAWLCFQVCPVVVGDEIVVKHPDVIKRHSTSGAREQDDHSHCRRKYRVALTPSREAFGTCEGTSLDDLAIHGSLKMAAFQQLWRSDVPDLSPTLSH